MERFIQWIESANLDKKDFQLEGAKWCLDHELAVVPDGQRKGGIIADEMGLGKTILMVGVIHANPVRNTLIVLPVALVKQWHKAILDLTGHNALVYNTTSNRKKISTDVLHQAPVVITTYNIVTMCAEKEDSPLHTVRWGRVIYDEAHHLRNANTTRHKSCEVLTTNIAWIVSGTPIQNRQQDLYALSKLIGVELTASQLKNNDFKVNYLNKYMLRRTKQEVGIELPPLHVTTIQVPWVNKYEKQLSSDLHKSLSFCDVTSKGDSILSDDFGHDVHALSMIIRSRQSCILPSLMTSYLMNLVNQYEEEITEGHFSAIRTNSKMNAVTELILSRKDNGAGKLVFCHFTQEIDELKARLQLGGIENVVTYDGRNSRGINLANTKASVLILQIQTGCEGLNLQKQFSEIYFPSPHWNPSIEDQAIARCYRIGQEKEVNVFKFVMDSLKTQPKEGEAEEVDDETAEQEDLDSVRSGNIECYINLIQEAKREMIKETLEKKKEEATEN